MPIARSRRVMLVAITAIALAGTAHAQSSDDLAKIMDTYAAALRSGDAEKLTSLYTTNGVFMREDMKAVVGTPALRASYREVFATLKVDLRFTIHESEISGDMAWLRGISSGKVKVLATGVETDESFNQLVVFRKDGGAWKIRSYLYASNRGGPQVSK
jgi:ketosteroid isomerase-like protein